MKSFLITFKPATENPDLGWPLDSLQGLIKQLQGGKRAIEPWRFNNRKELGLGDRVFLLLQGKRGPAIIGYGITAGRPENVDGRWQVPVEFEAPVDPTVEVLAGKGELLG